MESQIGLHGGTIASCLFPLRGATALVRRRHCQGDSITKDLPIRRLTRGTNLERGATVVANCKEAAICCAAHTSNTDVVCGLWAAYFRCVAVAADLLRLAAR